MNKPAANQYIELLGDIGRILEAGRQQAAKAVNVHMVVTYREIGRYIVEFEQAGEHKATYGKELLKRLSKDLSQRFGKGFSMSNLFNFRKFYLQFEIFQTVSGNLEQIDRIEKIQTVSGKLAIKLKDAKSETVSHLLSWSHYCELMKLDDPLETGFYMKQSENENWSVRELRRQIDSGLFHRLALSKNKKGVLALAKNGQQTEQPSDIIRSPYIFEFLNLPEKGLYHESDLEKALLDKLQHFLLELGKGFAFIGRQKRITLSNRHYKVDMVFYNRILKCFVLFDLKVSEVSYKDIGQMNMYLNYFEKEENVEGDNKPIGVVLAATKDDIMVEYALGNISSQLFVSTYQLYLPDKKELKEQLEKIIEKE